MGKLQVKRIYEAPAETDGAGSWWTGSGPGASKRNRGPGWGEKEIAPTNGLPGFSNHDPEKFPEFLCRLYTGVEANPEAGVFLEK